MGGGRSRGAIVGVGAAFILAACGQVAGPTPTGAPALVTGAIDGLLVTLTAERSTMTAGDRAHVRLTVANVTTSQVLWWSGSCELERAIEVTPLAPPGPVDGRAWPGDAGVLKDRLTDGSGAPVPPERLEPMDPLPDCRADRGFNILEPRGQAELTAAWVAVDRLGAPLPAGRYRIRGVFPRIRSDLALDPAQVVVARDVDPVIVESDLAIDDPGPTLSAGIAVDRLLAHPAFATWLAAHPRRDWAATDMRWTDGAWRIEVRTRRGSFARATIDRAGAIRDIELRR